MAPELFQKQGVYSYASDLWSLGCVLFEMATGKPPFSSNSLKELVTQVMDAPTPHIDSCSKIFNDLLAGLLEKDPVKRSTWDLVRVNPCWPEAIPELQLPTQPLFDAYLESRGIRPGKYYEKPEAEVKSRTIASAMKPGPESAKRSEDSTTSATTGGKRRDVDLMRLSQTVKKNILKDAAEYTRPEAEKGSISQGALCRSQRHPSCEQGPRTELQRAT